MTLYNKEFDKLPIEEQNDIKLRFSKLIYFLDKNDIDYKAFDYFLGELYFCGFKGHFNMDLDELIDDLNKRNYRKIVLNNNTHLQEILDYINVLEKDLKERTNDIIQ